MLRRLRAWAEDESGMVTASILTLALLIVGTFLAVMVGIPYYAGQQLQSVKDEIAATARFTAAAARANIAATTLQSGILTELADQTAGQLLGRPVNGNVLGDQAGAVGEADVASVTITGVQVIAPGEQVPGTTGLTARVEGADISYTMHLSVLGGLVQRDVAEDGWAFAGTE